MKTMGGSLLVCAVSVLACMIPGLFLSACTQKTELVAGGEVSADKNTDALKPAQGLRVRLLEPGTAPHRVLRYHFAPQEKMSVEITLDTATKATLVHLSPPEVRFPTLKLCLGLRFDPVRADGTLRASFRLDRTEVKAGDDDLHPNVLDGLRSDLKGLEGLAGFAVVDPRGFTLEASAELPPESRPKMIKDQTEELRQLLQQFAVPLPEEPVGPGASWEVHSELAWEWLRIGQQVYAFHGEQTTIYRLTTLEGDRLQLKVELNRAFPAQETMPSNKVGAPGKLEAFRTQGIGKLSVDLRVPVPEASLSLETHKRTSVRLRPDREPRESSSDTTSKLTFRSQ